MSETWLFETLAGRERHFRVKIRESRDLTGLESVE